MSNIWPAVFNVYTILWCIPAVTSEDQSAFSLAVPVNGTTVYFNFTDVMFHKFYHCLRNRNNDQCEIQRDAYNKVTSVRGCLPVGNTGTIDELTCKPLTAGVLCKRGSFSNASQIVRCPDASFHDYEIRNDADLSTTARTTWLGFDIFLMESHISGITVERLSSPAQSFKYAITGTFTTILLPPPPTTTIATTTPATSTIAATTTATTTITTTTTATTKTAAKTTTTTTAIQRSTKPAVALETSTSTTSASPTTPATNDTGSPGQKGEDSDDNMSIIIGAAVGGAVVVVIILMIVVILWRRRKKSSASPATSKSNQYEDTDIYPYGESTRPTNNVNPNLNSNNLNHNSNQPTPDVYAIVDPSKKLNKTSSSDANNANSNNHRKSQEERSYSNGSVDYTEVNIDNGSVHYQRSSDANNDQEIPTSEMPPPFPSDSSAKPNHYNVYSETGKDPSEPYTQVVKKNKMEEERAASEEGEGSSPAPDPSGYEEAVPRTDTQYTTVMDTSVKNKLNPAPDSVYAKLHDPVRNITDVYNEGPVTVEENAGE